MWSKTPPSKADYWWVRHAVAGALVYQVAHWTGRYWRSDSGWIKSKDDMGKIGFEFGPRIPSPDAIEAAKEVLRECDDELSQFHGGVFQRLSSRARAALEKLEGRS